MPQLDPTYFASQLFWLFVSFFVLYILMASVVLPRISRALQNREEKISNYVESAKLLRDEVEQLERQYTDANEDTRFKANEIIAEATKKSQKFSAEKLAQLDAKLSEESKKADEALKASRDEAMKEIANVSTELSISAIQKIVGVDVSEDVARKTVNSIKDEAA